MKQNTGSEDSGNFSRLPKARRRLHRIGCGKVMERTHGKLACYHESRPCIKLKSEQINQPTIPVAVRRKQKAATKNRKYNLISRDFVNSYVSVAQLVNITWPDYDKFNTDTKCCMRPIKVMNFNEILMKYWIWNNLSELILSTNEFPSSG